MRVPKLLVWLLAIAVLGGGGFALWQAYESFPSSGSPSQDGWTSTPTGPVGPADRDMVVRVHLASLWEHPIGQQMAERGTQSRVREVGRLISIEHLELDDLDIAAAHELGIELPTQPTIEQQGWLAQANAASGPAFDTTAVNLLRAAHGTVLPLLTTVRASTRNSAVRLLADQAAVFVTRHMNYLESTGLVNFDALPQAPTPTRSVVTTSGDYQQVPVSLIALGAVLLLTGTLWLIISVMSRRRSQRLYEPPRQNLDPPTNTGRHNIQSGRHEQ
jgi:predicted outer membrane protein